jgi:prophage DNA circulation protein
MSLFKKSKKETSDNAVIVISDQWPNLHNLLEAAEVSELIADEENKTVMLSFEQFDAIEAVIADTVKSVEDQTKAIAQSHDEIKRLGSELTSLHEKITAVDNAVKAATENTSVEAGDSHAATIKALEDKLNEYGDQPGEMKTQTDGGDDKHGDVDDMQKTLDEMPHNKAADAFLG